MNSCGILLIDKPVGISSFDVIRQLRRLTGIRKFGHTGTLDPFASGLLTILPEKTTRLAERLSAQQKEYLVTMKMGVKTATGDTEGEVIEQEKTDEIDAQALPELISQVLKITSQIPPKFSAIKIAGKRAYELARQQEDFSLEPRPIRIHEFEIIKYTHPLLSYRALVSKGTYIRSLSETIAEMLGTIGTTIELRRTAIGDQKVTNAVKLDELTEANWQDYLLPAEAIMPDFPRIKINDITDFKHGRQFMVEPEEISEVMVLSETGIFLGFGQISAHILQPTMVFI
ncbi:MAG TPA: tRNA pseudouridine(55) synthase TruB [Candidatus Cloacimonadota bacterium]|nr:tRNA pseudouridine(55) synthase TruB [Candidatus Cloacimonadota bacterium]